VKPLQHPEPQVVVRVRGRGVLVHPRHQPAQLVTDVLDLVLRRLLAELAERRFAGGVLRDPFLRELAALREAARREGALGPRGGLAGSR